MNKDDNLYTMMQTQQHKARTGSQKGDSDFRWLRGLSNDGIEPIMIVYRLDENTWKGFAHPYGETTEADTKEEAIGKIRDLTTAYTKIVKEYKNPTHLIHGGLDNVTDREVFSWVFANEPLLKELRSTGKADTENCYVEAYRDQSE